MLDLNQNPVMTWYRDRNGNSQPNPLLQRDTRNLTFIHPWAPRKPLPLRLCQPLSLC